MGLGPCRRPGLLFAADLADRGTCLECLHRVRGEIDAVKLGNALLYEEGPSLITQVKAELQLPVVADLKITDVGHVASRVAIIFARAGADAVVVSGVCGQSVCEEVIEVLPRECDLWLFTEFTHQTGLIDAELADAAIRVGLKVGVRGFQVPGTRLSRVRSVRTSVGADKVIVCCGMGEQGGQIGSAIAAGADMEIVGRAIFMAADPEAAAREARSAIRAAGQADGCAPHRSEVSAWHRDRD